MQFLYFLICFFVLPFSRAEHDIHVSVTEITQSENGEIEISVRIFFDDLLAAVGLTPGEELPDDYSSSDDLINKYIDQHLLIRVDGQQYEMDYIESFASMQAIWTTLKLRNFKAGKVKNIKIENSILTEMFDDQTNMVSVRIAEKKSSKSLNKKKKVAEFSL